MSRTRVGARSTGPIAARTRPTATASSTSGTRRRMRWRGSGTGSRRRPLAGQGSGTGQRVADADPADRARGSRSRPTMRSRRAPIARPRSRTGMTVAQVTCALYVLVSRRLLEGATDRADALGDARTSAPAAVLAARSARDAHPRGSSRPPRGVDGARWPWLRHRQLLERLGRVRRGRQRTRRRSSAPSATGTTPTLPRASRAASPACTGASTASHAEWREGMRGATIVEPMLDRLLTA